MKRPGMAAFPVLALLLCGTAHAQQTTTPAATTAAPMQPPLAVVADGRLEETHGGWRASRLVGARVYNDADQVIGTVDDVIIGKDDGKATTAVVSVGGFLGIGSKLVSVPYDQLKVELHEETTGVPTSAAGTPGLGTMSATPAPTGTGGPPMAAASASGLSPPVAQPTAGGLAATTNPAAPAVTYKAMRLVLPGATRDSLKAMTEFKYRES